MKEILFFLLLLLVVFSGCRPEPDAQDLVDEFVVATNYDASADFSAYTTYAIPTDTIGFISNSSNDTIIVASESSFPRPVLTAIRSNLNAIGYTEVEKNADPDLGINVLVVNDFNVFQDIVYPYNYPGNFYSGYYGYNSWYYYPYVQTYAYNTGVLIIEMVDLRNRTADNRVKVIWDAYMGDLYTTLNRIEQANSGINEAFSQSPYLGK